MFNIEAGDISELSSLVSLSATRSYTTIFYKTELSPGLYDYPVAVDSTVSELVISVNGFSISTTVLTPEGKPMMILTNLLPNQLCCSKFCKF